MTLNPILKVLSTLSTHHVQHLLMGGQACVLYGAAEFSRDTDIALMTEAENLRRLSSGLLFARNWRNSVVDKILACSILLRAAFWILNEEHVEYLIVGGYALAYCGLPRYTKDVDLYVRPDAENAARIADLKALGESS